MREIVTQNRFKRDLKRVAKRRYDLESLTAVIDQLASGVPLAARMRPHKLVGNYLDLWECHIEPDWLLIYDITETAVILVRTGTHSDLFD